MFFAKIIIFHSEFSVVYCLCFGAQGGIFGIGAGVLTVLIRFWGNYPEGVSFAILIMNILNPYIDALTGRKVFGGDKK